MKPTNVLIAISLPNEGDLSKDTTSHLGIFVLKFARRGIGRYTTLEWNGLRSRLMVTVDWEQEVECVSEPMRLASFLSF